MPEIFAGVRVKRDDRRQEQIVALVLRPDFAIPRAAVANTDIKLIKFRVIDNGIPDRTAAAKFNIFFAEPGGTGLGCDDIIGGRAVLDPALAGNGIEAPGLFAGGRVIGRDITANPIFRTAIADQHPALHDPRRTGDSIGFGLINGYHAPDRFAGLGINCDQPAIERPEKQFAIIGRQPTIDDIAAGLEPGWSRHLRIIGPQQLAGGRIQRDNL